MELREPTLEEVRWARNVIIEREPRDLFYHVATELIDLSIRNVTKVSLGEAVAVLLQTWNKNFFRFNKDRFTEQFLKDLEGLLESSRPVLMAFRERNIESFNYDDRPTINLIFTHFEHLLGPVGTAKCLHLMAPYFFPLWDRAITVAYGIKLRSDRSNADFYLKFMACSKQQYGALRLEGAPWPDLLKAIDEYNYWTYTLKPKTITAQQEDAASSRS